MLIDSSYFVGDINIPNSILTDVASGINNMIQRHEADMLTKAMGYGLFKAFSDGLLLPTVQQKWLDILFGKAYTDHYGDTQHWNGLITTNTPQMVISAGEIPTIFFTVGATIGAPNVGDTAYVNTTLANKSYTVNQRGLGALQVGVDIDITPTGGFTLRGGATFLLNQTYDIAFSGVVIDVVAGGYQVIPLKKSPVADFIYYQWQKSNHTFTSGLGEVSNTTPVVHRATVGLKPATAYNRFVSEMCMLIDFLQVNATTYPEYRASYPQRQMLTPINNFNI